MKRLLSLADAFRFQDLLELREWVPQSILPFLRVAMKVEYRMAGIKNVLRYGKEPSEVWLYELFNDISQEYSEFTNIVGRFRPQDLADIQKSIKIIKAIFQERYIRNWSTVSSKKSEVLVPDLCFYYTEIHVPTIQNLFKARRNMENVFIGRFLKESVSSFGMIKESVEKVIGGAKIF